MESNKVSVKIYGQEYIIAGQKSREHIIKVADHVDRNMHEISQAAGSLPVSSLAVLSAVNIADEYFEAAGSLEEQKNLSMQKDRDIQHYIQMWDEAKKNFTQYKEDSARLLERRDTLRTMVSEKDREIEMLRAEVSEAHSKAAVDCAGKLEEAQAKIKELESSFFDIQMENIQLKSELERFKRAQNNF